MLAYRVVSESGPYSDDAFTSADDVSRVSCLSIKVASSILPIAAVGTQIR